MTKENKIEMELTLQILDRAKKLGITQGDFITQLIDVEKATKQFNIRLKDWLEADDFNFCHDFVGIQNNMNRTTGMVENCFLPRFASEV